MLGLQVEAIHHRDTIEYSGYYFPPGVMSAEKYTASFDATSLIIPVLLKINGRPENIKFSLFGGLYYTMPLSKMEYTSEDISEEYDYSMPIGWTAGMELGFKMGPGALFIDGRYAADIGATSIKDANGRNMAVFERRMVWVTLGYELGLFGGRTYQPMW